MISKPEFCDLIHNMMSGISSAGMPQDPAAIKATFEREFELADTVRGDGEEGRGGRRGRDVEGGEECGPGVASSGLYPRAKT